MFLDTPPAKADDDKPSLQNWLMNSLGLDAAENTVFETGNSNWADGVAALEILPEDSTEILGKAVAKRSRSTPSGQKKDSTAARSGSGEGRRFGTAVHAAFENVGWIDEEEPEFPANSVGDGVRKILKLSEIRALFTRGESSVSLHREQRIEALIDGKWMSGAIDRLHLHRDAQGAVERVEIFDFKTDHVENAEELIERYAGQMTAYRKAMALMHPKAEISCLLVSTALGAVV